MSSVVNTFAERQTLNTLHTIVEDERMMALFEMLEEEGVVLSILDDKQKRKIS